MSVFSDDDHMLEAQPRRAPKAKMVGHSGDTKAIILRSPLTPMEIAYKMRDLIGDREGGASDGELTGRGSEQEMQLYQAGKFHNDGFRAKLVSDDEGTIIRGTFGKVIGPFERKVIYGFAGCISVALILAGIMLMSHGRPANSIFFFVPTIVMWVLLRQAMQKLEAQPPSPRTRKKIINFLRNHLNAEVVS